MTRLHGCIVVVVAVALGTAGPAAARPADVRIINAPQAPVPVTAAQPLPTTQGEYYRADGTMSVSGTFGSCTASLFTSLPPGRTFRLTNVEVDSSETVRPEFIIWLRQQTGSGFFTHFVGVPLTSFPVNGYFSGVLGLNDRIEPGSVAAGDFSDVFVCLAPGSGDSSTGGRYSLSGYLEP